MFVYEKETYLMHIINEMEDKPWHYKVDHPKFNLIFSYGEIAATAPYYGRFRPNGTYL